MAGISTRLINYVTRTEIGFATRIMRPTTSILAVGLPHASAMTELLSTLCRTQLSNSFAGVANPFSLRPLVVGERSSMLARARALTPSLRPAR